MCETEAEGLPGHLQHETPGSAGAWAAGGEAGQDVVSEASEAVLAWPSEGDGALGGGDRGPDAEAACRLQPKRRRRTKGPDSVQLWGCEGRGSMGAVRGRSPGRKSVPPVRGGTGQRIMVGALERARRASWSKGS